MKLFFPMQTLRVTQRYGVAYGGVKANTYSHAGGYALDLGGADGGADWLYAPCDMVVRRVYGSYNAVWFESLDEIDGVGGTVVMLCLHMNNADKEALGIKIGKVFKAGEKCYREGMSGNVTGTHVHLEIGKGPMRGTGWKQNAQGVWVINDPLVPSEVFVLKEDVRVLNDGGYRWMRAEEAIKPLSAEPVKMQCIASLGDQRVLGDAMDGLGIGYAVEGAIMNTLVAVSSGDQTALVAAAKPLGIEWTVPVEATEEELLAAAQDRVLVLEEENAKLQELLAEAVEKAEQEKLRADRAQEQSAAWLKMIEAARAALGGVT
jgi:hypothetical protein